MGVQKNKIQLVLEPQHSCFSHTTGDGIVVTVYHPRKKIMRLYEVNTALDMAKDHLMGRMR